MNDREDLLLIYDFLKHLTTLSLVTIGGVLSFLQAGNIDFKKTSSLIALGAISLAGGLSLLFLGNIVSSELLGRSAAQKRKSLAIVVQMALLIYVGGLGFFVGSFSSALNRPRPTAQIDAAQPTASAQPSR